MRLCADTHLLGLFDAAAENAERTVLLLRDVLIGYPDGTALADDIVRCEREGDRITREILRRAAEAGTGGVMEAWDAARLAHALDDVVDHAEEAACRLSIYAVEAPMEPAERLADSLVACAQEVTQALKGLRTEGDTGRHLRTIHRLESEADRVTRAALASLFLDGIDPMTVIRWKDIFETLEAAVDACERVADLLEGIVVKSARPSAVIRRGARVATGSGRPPVSDHHPRSPRTRVPEGS